MAAIARIVIPGLAVLALGGCWNGENVNVRLGDVSLGRQLMDLKAARDAGVIDDEEYARLRSAMIEISQACGNDREDAADRGR